MHTMPCSVKWLVLRLIELLLIYNDILVYIINEKCENEIIMQCIELADVEC